MALEKFTLRGSKYVIDKDPNAVLDYTVDFSKMLVPLEDAITSATVTVTGGLVVDSVTYTDYTVTAWLSGGTITVEGAYASATFKFTTVNNPARIDERTVFFNVLER